MGIVADFKGLQTMGFEVGSSPDLTHLPGGDPRILGHQANTPVSRLLGYSPGSQCEDLADFFSPDFERLTTTWQVAQALDARLQLAFSPLEHCRRRDLQRFADDLGRQSIRQ